MDMKKKRIMINRKTLKKTDNEVNITFDAPLTNQQISSLKKELSLKGSDNTFIAIILRKSKTACIVRVPSACKSFSIDGNTYFCYPSGNYIAPKTTLLSIYLEGCTLPLEHSYIRYEKHNILLIDKFGKPVKDIPKDMNNDIINSLPRNRSGEFLKSKDGFIICKQLDRIKGLEFDTTIADAIFNSGLVEKITTGSKIDKLIPIIFIISIIGIAISVASCVISYLRV